MSASDNTPSHPRGENLKARAAREPLGVDISDYSDEWCAGFLAGQVNALDHVAVEEWTEYHEFRKRTDPPPYGLGLDDA
jgi:hypothetical protein